MTKREALEEAIAALKRSNLALRREPIAKKGLNSSGDRLDYIRHNERNVEKLREELEALDNARV